MLGRGQQRSEGRGGEREVGKRRLFYIAKRLEVWNLGWAGLGLAAAAFMGFHLEFWALVESRGWASVH